MGLSELLNFNRDSSMSRCDGRRRTLNTPTGLGIKVKLQIPDDSLGE